jgi:hypothetical protein
MIKNKKGVTGLIDAYAAIVMGVIFLISGIIFGVVTQCSGPNAEEIAGRDTRSVSFDYQLNSFLRSPVAVNITGQSTITMADAIVNAMYYDQKGSYILIPDEYATVAYYSSTMLKGIYGSICASMSLELVDEKGEVMKSRELGFCPFSEVAGEAEIPYMTTQKTIKVKLNVGGETTLYYGLCDKGDKFDKESRYYCEEFSGIGSCGYLAFGDTRLAWYDKMSRCEKNLERVKENKDVEKLNWALCKMPAMNVYVCNDFSTWWYDKCPSMIPDFVKGVAPGLYAAHVPMVHVASYATENECESSKPK